MRNEKKKKRGLFLGGGVTKPRRMRGAGRVARMGERLIQGLGEGNLRERQLGKPRHIFNDNIKMDYVLR